MGIWGPVAAMPPAVAAMHGDAPTIEARGVARVERGRGLAGWVARRFGFPAPGAAVRLHVRVTRDAAGETWVRDFAGQLFESRLSRRDGWLVEAFGPLAFGFALERDGDAMVMMLRRWWLGGLRLPLWLAPRVTAREADVGGRFRFDVRVALPVFGLVVAYQGQLALVPGVADPLQWSLADEHRERRYGG